MSRRLSALAHHASGTLLLWVGSLVLGLADAMYAGVVPGVRSRHDHIALALAGTAGLLFVVAGLRGIAGLRSAPPAVAARTVAGTGALPGTLPGGLMAAGRRWWVPRLPTRTDAVGREAERGIAELEAWLAGQDHSRDG